MCQFLMGLVCMKQVNDESTFDSFMGWDLFLRYLDDSGFVFESNYIV